ncbi:unnamed protein product [Caenorhabditis brenneri]
MTIISEKLVLFSSNLADEGVSEDENHVENRKLDSSLMLLEVTKTTSKLRAITPQEAQKLTENINKSVKAIKESVKTEKPLFNVDQVGSTLNALGGIGDIVKGIAKFVPEPEDPVVQNLNKLEKNVKELEKKMAHDFDEMKSFITEVNFFKKIVSPVSILNRYWRDCLKHPCPEAVANFKAIYKDYDPLNLAYTLNSFLEQDSTNPIRMALDVRHDSVTLRKWETIIYRILDQLLVLEAFATGYLSFSTQVNTDQLIEAANDAKEKIKELKEMHEFDKHWDEIIIYMKDFINKHPKLKNTEKAEIIKKKLATFSTTDAFYIIVCDDSSDEKYFRLQKFVRDDQFIEVRENGTRVLVYRSFFANSTEIEHLEKMREECQSFEQDYKQDPEMPQKLIDYRFKNAGFSLLLGFIDEAIVSVNCPTREYGPGWWTVPWNFGESFQQRLVVGFH